MHSEETDMQHGASIAAVLPLAPSQLGMFFEAVANAVPGRFVEQLAVRLHGSLDVVAWRRAWAGVVRRHAMLRTCFAWNRANEPRQIVMQAVPLEVDAHDWSDLSVDDREAALRALLAADREQGFDLAAPPLMRLAVIRLAEQEHYFVWSHHHLLSDGWSIALMLREVLDRYGHDRQRLSADGFTADIRPARPFADYLDWLERQDRLGAESFWRRYLLGLSRYAGQIPPGRSSGASLDHERYKDVTVELGAASTAALLAVARRQRVTPGDLVQACWALALGRRRGASEQVIGVTVSGRPPDLPGAMEIVGPFTNTMPLRVPIAPGESVAAWLRRIHHTTIQRRPYEFCSTSEIHAWSGLAAGQRLFEALCVIENTPTVSRPLPVTGLTIDEAAMLNIGSRTRYPLSLLARLAGDDAPPVLSLRLLFDTEMYDDTHVRSLLADLVVLFEELPIAIDQPLAGLLQRLPEPAPVLPAPLADTTPLPPLDGGARLARLLSETLGIGALGGDANLFDLGGHSLLAMHLIACIEREFGRRVALSDVLRYPTPASLDRFLRGAEPDTAGVRLVALHPAGHRIPFCCIPGRGGSILYLRALAHHLGADQPFYALQAAGLDGRTPPHRSVEEMARAYAAEIRAAWPCGPVAIGGHSLGGWVAFDCVRLLEQAGVPVALLALFDTAPLVEPVPNAEDELAALEELVSQAEDLNATEIGVHQPILRVLGARAGLHHVVERLRLAGIDRSWQAPRELRLLHQVAFAHRQIRYRPTGCCHAPVVLFRAQELDRMGAQLSAQIRCSEDWGWHAYCAAPPEIISVPGNHVTMMREPHVPHLAAVLGARLVAAEKVR